MDNYKKNVAEVEITPKIVWSEFTSKVKTEFASIGKQFASELTSAIKTAFSDAIEEMKSMLEYSQLSNAATREYAFKYGFSSSEAYGFDKALSAVGLSSEEDLFYANTQELQQFRTAFEKYSNRYQELYDKGFFEQMQEYQFEMADFKNEVTLEIVQFFMDNKDTIKTVMKAIIDVSKFIVQALGWIVDLLNGPQRATVSEVVTNYRTSNTNVSVNNSFTNVAKNDETWLVNAGELTYEQIIQALGGK